jgi:uncharacterized protein YjiS (DUF1127 family)
MTVMANGLTDLSRPRPRIAVRACIEGAAARLVAWDARYRERRRIAELADETLRDAGLTRAFAVREAARPFWRA